MKLLLSLFVSSLLIVSVYGHAKLVSPTAFNPNPSKAAPCGDGPLLPGPAANWPPNSQQQLDWTVVAGDGTGPVRAFIDPKGVTTNFPKSVPAAGVVPPGLTEIVLSGTVPTQTIPYTFTFTVPNVVCEGTAGCTVVVFSSTSWWACTAVNISMAVRNTNTSVSNFIAPTCQNATGLKFCTMVNNKAVSVPFGQTLESLDNGASVSFDFNLANPKVFTTPNNAGCVSAYKNLICATMFRRCGNGLIAQCDYFTGSSPYGCFCSRTCIKARDICGLNMTHEALLNCDSSQIADSDATTPRCNDLVFDATTDRGASDDNGLSTGGASTLVVAIFSLVVVICFAFI